MNQLRLCIKRGLLPVICFGAFGLGGTGCTTASKASKASTEETSMPRIRNGADPQLGAATMTLLILRSAASPEERLEPGILLNGHKAPIEDAVNALAALPKPVVCTATTLNGVLSISCRPASASELQQRDFADSRPRMFFAEHRESLTRSRLPVQMIGREYEAIISVAAIDRWSTDYMIDMPYGFLYDRPSWRARLLGVGLVMTAIRGGEHRVIPMP